MKFQLSAQESRRKRKEYMDALEQKVQGYYNENTALKAKVVYLNSFFFFNFQFKKKNSTKILIS